MISERLSDMQTCPSCQYQNDDDAQFCCKCGKAINPAVKSGTKTPSKGNTVVLVIGIILVMIALAASGATYFLSQKTKREAERQTASVNARIEQFEAELSNGVESENVEETATEADETAKKYEPYVTTAKKAVIAEWKKLLKRSKTKNDGYIEIVSTRVIKLAKNKNDYFKNVDYVVEFILRSDYYGSAPYYFNVNMYDNVVFYKDGTCKVTSGFFRTYLAEPKTKVADFDKVIEEIAELGDAFNEAVLPESAEPTEEQKPGTTEADGTSSAEEQPTAETESEKTEKE